MDRPWRNMAVAATAVTPSDSSLLNEPSLGLRLIEVGQAAADHLRHVGRIGTDLLGGRLGRGVPSKHEARHQYG